MVVPDRQLDRLIERDPGRSLSECHCTEAGCRGHDNLDVSYKQDCVLSFH
jgi:hypothetical protein